MKMESITAWVDLIKGKRRTRRDEAKDVVLGQPAQQEHKRRKIMSSQMATGQNLCENVGRILVWLDEDKISSIGIYGMGGIGKTTLARQLHTQLLNRVVVFTNLSVLDVAVAWVSVGLNFTVYQLQHHIAVKFGLDLQDEKDLNRRAACLYALLSCIPKVILFLDDLWAPLQWEEVGVPKTCKLILISRSSDVCRVLGCQKLIKVEPLPEEEAWQLFSHTNGSGVLESKEIMQSAKHLCNLCGGVPLAITALASSMRGVVDASTWSNAVDSMNRSPTCLTQLDDTFKILRLSYENLSNIKLKSCLLYCALYPKGYAIRKEELIHLWNGEMLVSDVESWQAMYDMGHSVLNKLINSGWLEISEDKSTVKMHDLLKYLALSIAGDSFTVKSTPASTETHTELQWWENLHAVSLIKSLPGVTLDVSPRCPSLSILLLQHNYLHELPDSFFLHMRALRVLNLSHTCIERLPSSFSDLCELRLLDVSCCPELTEVPSIAKLKKLRYLDLSHTALTQAPLCLDMLEMLTELNISCLSLLIKFPWEMLPALSRLKKLSCNITGTIPELQNLKALQVFEARFETCIDLSNYVRSRHWRALESFHLQVGHNKGADRSCSKGVSLHDCSLSGEGGDYIVLPDNIQELHLDDCKGLNSLTDILNPVNACESIDRDSSSNQNSTATASCKGDSGFLRHAGAFRSLEICTISRCHDVEKLFTTGWIRNLPQLASIEIEDCRQLKKLIAEEVEESSYNERSHTVISLPHLHQIVLTHLPQLNSIYSKGTLVCASLRSLLIVDCPKLNPLDRENLVRFSLECIEGHEVVEGARMVPTRLCSNL